MQFSIFPLKITQEKNIKSSYLQKSSIFSFKPLENPYVFKLNKKIDQNINYKEDFTNTINKNMNIPSSISLPKKMLWGEPTWLFLHTIAHKVKDEYFYLIKLDLLNNIYSICSNLPCPICASHAKEHLNSINFNSIQTKEQLKLMLFHFHNLVNIRKNLPEFLLEDLDNKYSLAILKNIINHFVKYYTNKTGIIKMVSEDFYRKLLIENIINWLNRNINCFNY